MKPHYNFACLQKMMYRSLPSFPPSGCISVCVYARACVRVCINIYFMFLSGCLSLSFSVVLYRFPSKTRNLLA